MIGYDTIYLMQLILLQDVPQFRVLLVLINYVSFRLHTKVLHITGVQRKMTQNTGAQHKNRPLGI